MCICCKYFPNEWLCCVLSTADLFYFRIRKTFIQKKENKTKLKYFDLIRCSCFFRLRLFFYLFYFSLKNRGNSLRRFKNGSKWRTKEISIDGKPPTFSSSSAAAAAANRNSANLSTSELSPALLAQANWTFVEKLLKVSVLFANSDCIQFFQTSFQFIYRFIYGMEIKLKFKQLRIFSNRIVKVKQSVCCWRKWARKRLHSV